mgnify:CR=1 FL=1
MDEEIQTYLLMKASEGRAASTLYEYRLYLCAFANHCGKKLEEVTPSDVAAWIVEERTKGLADASILARHRAVRIFFNWCVAFGYVEKSPVTMRNPKVKREAPRVASLADVQALLNYPVDDWLSYRNRAIVHLLLDTGMRVSEAASLLIHHLDLDGRLVTIPAGKDGEARVAPFSVDCQHSLTSYLEERPDRSNQLFVSRWGWLTTYGIRDMLHVLCARAGVPYVNPHSLRHLFATKALNDGMRVEIVSRILGHASVDLTLRVYAHLLTETMKKEYEQYWKNVSIIS